MPSINTAVGLKPSTRKILAHIQRRGSISPLEAQVSYGIARLAPCVYDLRQVGYNVKTALRQDEAGHPYARYSIGKRVG